jgi:hypothetical protein
VPIITQFNMNTTIRLSSPFTQNIDELLDLLYEKDYDESFNDYSPTHPLYVQILDWRNEVEDSGTGDPDIFEKVVMVGRGRFEQPFLVYINDVWDDVNNVCRLDSKMWKKYDVLRVTCPIYSNCTESYLTIQECHLASRPSIEINCINRLIKMRRLVHLGWAVPIDINTIEDEELKICIGFIVNVEEDIFIHILREMIDMKAWTMTDELQIKRVQRNHY